MEPFLAAVMIEKVSGSLTSFTLCTDLEQKAHCLVSQWFQNINNQQCAHSENVNDGVNVLQSSSLALLSNASTFLARIPACSDGIPWQ